MKDLIQFMLQFIKENKKFYIINIVTTLINSLLKVSIPLYFKYYLDHLKVDHSVSNILALFLFFILLTLSSNIVSVFWHYMTTKLGVNILFNLRRDVATHLEQCPSTELKHQGIEKIKNIIYYDTLEIFRSIVAFVTNLVAHLLVIIFVFIILFFFDKKVFALVVGAFTFGLILANFSRKRISVSSKNVNASMKGLNAFFNIFVDSINLNKNNLLHNYYYERHQKLSNNFMDVALKNDVVQVFLKNLLDNINYIFSILLITYLTIEKSYTSVGDVVLIIFYSNIIFNYAQSIETIYASIGTTLPSFSHLATIFKLKKAQRGEVQASEIKEIALKDLSFSYDQKKIVLDQLNLCFKTGDRVLITGPNGGGKTTLLNLLIGILEPNKGLISFNGISRTKLENKTLLSQFLIINHDDLFLDESIIDYFKIILNNKDLSEDKIKSLVAELNLFEDKVDVNVSEFKLDYKGSFLSSGQKKKLLLMKLLLGIEQAKVIVIDEIESNLDIKSRDKYLAFKKDLIAHLNNKIFFEISHQKFDEKYLESFYTHQIEVADGKVVSK